ncbi:hypothetical protein FRB90_010627 [Tulasnella sp. 427]|nr:hypothetical protein FRB90_010627 [Tulasnella sp. 427]
MSVSDTPVMLSAAEVKYYLSANPMYRHKMRWRLEQSGQIPAASGSSNLLMAARNTSAESVSPSETFASLPASSAPDLNSSVPTTPHFTQGPPVTLKSKGSTVTPTKPRRLPLRTQYPNAKVFTVVWREHETAKVEVRNSLRNIRDLVDAQDSEGPSKRRRSEKDIVDELWVEGPERTAAIVRYIKAKERVDKIEGILSDLHAKYQAESRRASQQVTPSPAQTASTLTPLPSRLSSVAPPSEPIAETSASVKDSNKRLTRAAKRGREEDTVSSPPEEPANATRVKRIRLTHSPSPVKETRVKRIRITQSSTQPATEEESSPLKSPLSSTFKGKENALDLTLA